MGLLLVMRNFNSSLVEGKTGETQIAKWLMGKGRHILPIYEIAENQYKGPALYCNDKTTIIAPDMAVFSHRGLSFIEAKHKNAFSWYRKKRIWTTGIDRHHFEQYVNFRKTLRYKLWILFLHRGGQAKDSMVSPSGLFGNDIDILENKIDHESDNWGKSGMVYWDKDSLVKLSNYPLEV